MAKLQKDSLKFNKLVGLLNSDALRYNYKPHLASI
jgi:hypothetical protein